MSATANLHPARRGPAAASRRDAPLQIRDLTVPVDDTTTLRRLIVRDVRRWSEALRGLPLGRFDEADRPGFVAIVAAIAALEASTPARAAALLRLPTISVLIELCWRHRDEGRGDAALDAAWRAQAKELVWLLLGELALLDALPPAGVRVLRPAAGWLPWRSLTAGLLVQLADDVAEIRWHGRGFETIGAAPANLSLADPGEGPWTWSRPYHPIAPGLFLAETDNNPLSSFEAHPDKDGNQLDLGRRPAADWVAVLAECVGLVDRYLPLIAEEMRLLLRLCIPVGVDDEKHLSASFQEYIGAIYLTLHPNVMTMVEALIHEFQHNKINVAFHHDPMLRNAFWPLVTSPVRPDPRPLHGVVLAVHAFQPIAMLYQRMQQDGHPFAQNPAWQRRAATIFAKIHEGAVTVLGQGDPTPVGQQLLDEMRALDAALMAYAREVGWLDANHAVAIGPERGQQAMGGDEP